MGYVEGGRSKSKREREVMMILLKFLLPLIIIEYLGGVQGESGREQHCTVNLAGKYIFP